MDNPETKTRLNKAQDKTKQKTQHRKLKR